MICRHSNRKKTRGLRARQIEAVQGYSMTGLFRETNTRHGGASTITPYSPELVAELPYRDLARELNEPRLAGINDSFKVWYKKVRPSYSAA